MRKFLKQLAFHLTFIALFAYPGHAYADLCPTGFESLCQIRIGEGSKIVWNIVSILLVLAIVLTLIYLIYGGIRWITSGGDKGKVDEARKHITAAIIGLVIALGAFIILSTVTRIFTGKGFNEFSVPTLLD